MPARPGTGIVASSPVRLVLELAGYRDVLATVKIRIPRHFHHHCLGGAFGGSNSHKPAGAFVVAPNTCVVAMLGDTFRTLLQRQALNCRPPKVDPVTAKGGRFIGIGIRLGRFRMNPLHTVLKR